MGVTGSAFISLLVKFWQDRPKSRALPFVAGWINFGHLVWVNFLVKARLPYLNKGTKNGESIGVA